jgi:hypothetical protein
MCSAVAERQVECGWGPGGRASVGSRVPDERCPLVRATYILVGELLAFRTKNCVTCVGGDIEVDIKNGTGGKED